VDYNKFIVDYEAGKESDQTLYDFACLKIARHSLQNIIATEVEDDLKKVLKNLNKIHANNSDIEHEFEK